MIIFVVIVFSDYLVSKLFSHCYRKPKMTLGWGYYNKIELGYNK